MNDWTISEDKSLNWQTLIQTLRTIDSYSGKIGVIRSFSENIPNNLAWEGSLDFVVMSTWITLAPDSNIAISKLVFFDKMKAYFYALESMQTNSNISYFVRMGWNADPSTIWSSTSLQMNGPAVDPSVQLQGKQKQKSKQ